ncbi:hypothetical protein [Rhodopseudomonas sp. B29]|uniref:hypothetical protein n=1 Tax=Rhodopseudomonas sp. B29 TaxID=95607 RepID=UPI0003B450E1|nr:hypothetical protein [Rhodopseudomonas sp. B29]
MRTVSFVLSLVIAFAGASIAASSQAGTSESGLPGIGTFSYVGDPIEGASSPLVVATR